MKVSIVTISYNQGRFLEQCIQSVLQQSYPDIEYIVVDPGSTDGSREIVQKYSNRISKIILEPDNGPADGLNKGFQSASGDIYGYLNSDDYLLPTAVSKMVNAFHKKTVTDVISAHGFVVDGQGSILHREFSWPFSLKSYVAGCGTVMQQATFFRADIFRQTQGFNITNTTCWDGELMVEMALKGAEFALLNQFIACFRIHPGSISGSARLQQEFIKTVEQIISRIDIYPPTKLLRMLYMANRLKNPYALFWRVLDEIIHFGGRRLTRKGIKK